MHWKETAAQLKTDIPAVWVALQKRETPIAAKLAACLTVMYALSPIDLVPDFIPVLGYLDDLLVLPALVALTIRLIPKDVFARCRAEAAQAWSGGRPKKWYYALPVLAVWLLVLFLLLRAVLPLIVQ